MERKRLVELGKIIRKARGSRGQDWIAFECHVTQAAVSEWENGKNSMSVSHLGQIAFLLKLDPTLVADLAGHKPERIVSEYQRYAFGGEHLQQIIEKEDRAIDLLRKLWIGGLPWDAIELGMAENKQLAQRLQEVSPWQNRQPLLLKQAELLSQLVRVCASSFLPHDAFRVVSKIAEYQEAIAIEFAAQGSKDNRPLVRAYHSQGDAFYLVRKDESLGWYLAALDAGADLQTRLELTHDLCLISALRRDTAETMKQINQMYQLLEKGQFGSLHESLVTEAKSRADLLMGRREAGRDALEQDSAILSEAEAQGRPMVLRLIQNKRSRLQYMFGFGKDANVEQMRAELTDLINLVRRHGYYYYIGELERLTVAFAKQYPKFVLLLELFSSRVTYPDSYLSHAAFSSSQSVA